MKNETKKAVKCPGVGFCWGCPDRFRCKELKGKEIKKAGV
jgi:hypothetical protein